MKRNQLLFCLGLILLQFGLLVGEAGAQLTIQPTGRRNDTTGIRPYRRAGDLSDTNYVEGKYSGTNLAFTCPPGFTPAGTASTMKYCYRTGSSPTGAEVITGWEYYVFPTTPANNANGHLIKLELVDGSYACSGSGTDVRTNPCLRRPGIKYFTSTSENPYTTAPNWRFVNTRVTSLPIDVNLTSMPTKTLSSLPLEYYQSFYVPADTRTLLVARGAAGPAAPNPAWSDVAILPQGPPSFHAESLQGVSPAMSTLGTNQGGTITILNGQTGVFSVTAAGPIGTTLTMNTTPPPDPSLSDLMTAFPSAVEFRSTPQRDGLVTGTLRFNTATAGIGTDYVSFIVNGNNAPIYTVTVNVR